jgi:alpha-aminoadipic semialdehyde synthase
MTPLDSEAKFDKQEYYKQPEKYKSVFNIKFLPYLSALFHCIFWSPNCPRYIENKDLK